MINCKISLGPMARVAAFCMCIHASTVSVSAHPAWGIAIDTTRHVVYFSDLERVWKIDAAGRKSVFLDDVHTHDLYLDTDGNLVGENHRIVPGTNTWRYRYWKATPNGQVRALPERDAIRFFDRWDAEGNRYRLSNEGRRATITRLTPTGKSTILAGGAFGYADGAGSDARLRLFADSVWGRDGCLYFTNGGLVRKLTRDGNVTTIVGPEHGFPHSVDATGRPIASRLLGITINPTRDIVFADIRQHKVFRRAVDGTLTVLVDSGPDWFPSGVAYADGRLYVLEYPAHTRAGVTPRVRIRTPTGELRSLSTR